MTTTLETKLQISSWDEKAYRELPDGSRFTRAEVVLDGDGADVAAATFEAVMYYRPDGTSSYVTLMQITGSFDGRSGRFVLRGEGGYDGTAASTRSVVVEGSGTGELAGLSGTAESVSTHADYPYMPLTLRLDLE